MGVKIREKPKGSGVWWVFVNHNGKRKSKRVGGEKAAREAAERIEAKLILGDFDIDARKKSILFKEYAEKYLLSPHRKASTVRGYQSILNNHVYPTFASKEISEITRDDVKGLLFNAAARKIQMQTVLSGIFAEAVEDGYIDKNPAIGLKKYLRRKDDSLNGDSIEDHANPFDKDEQGVYMAKCWELYPNLAPFFFTLLRTGMRTSEGIGLKPEDVDFDEMVINIRRAIVEGELTTPKNGKNRIVEMTPQLASALQDHMSKLPGEWLFTNGNGKPLDAGRLRRWHYDVCKKADLKKRGMHQLRHTYATLRLSMGHSIADVSKQLGHESIDLTYGTYYRWIPSEGKRQVNDLDDTNWSAPDRTLYAPWDILEEKKVSEHVH